MTVSARAVMANATAESMVKILMCVFIGDLRWLMAAPVFREKDTAAGTHVFWIVLALYHFFPIREWTKLQFRAISVFFRLISNNSFEPR